MRHRSLDCINPVGGLYSHIQGDRIPNASAVHKVVQNENGEWVFSGLILCLFQEPILIIDKWDKQITHLLDTTPKQIYKRVEHFYIALYKDNTIAVPLKWITGKDPIYKRVEDGSV